MSSGTPIPPWSGPPWPPGPSPRPFTDGGSAGPLPPPPPPGRVPPRPTSGPGSDHAATAPMPPELRSALASPSGRRIGRYAVTGELGRGGMGVVLRAFDTELRREVAIKMLAAGARSSEKARARFVREARAVASLRHPGIVAVHEVGEHAGEPYLVMDLVRGESLAALLERDGRPPPRRAAAIVREVALALVHAHDHGLIHRDVKPQNVMIDAEGRARLMDFGLARELQSGGPTVSGELLGTPAYMAPEQVSGSRGALGPATDVWALGAVLYETLTGRPPFVADDSWALLRLVVAVEPEAPRQLDASIHADLETIALRCLQKEPARRYASAADLAEELRRWLDGEAILARPLGRLERAGRWVRRNRLLAALAAVLLAGAVAAPAALLVQARRAAREARLGLVAGARERAREAWAHQRDLGENASEDDLARDPARAGALLAAGFEAVEAGGRWVALDPDDERARAQTVRAARELARVARAAGQWAVAAAALRRAEETASDPEEAGRAWAERERLEADRREMLARHRREVARVLDPTRASELTDDERWREALLVLVRRAGEETARQIGARLAGLAAELREAAAETLLAAAEPDADERRAGAGAIEGLVDAIARWRALAPGAPLPQEAAGPIAAAHERLVRRARRERPDDSSNATPGAAHLLAAAQARQLGAGKLRLAALCAEALGHMGMAEGAVEPLAAYLFSEQDELRAQTAATALLRLGRGREAVEALVAGRFETGGPLGRELDRLARRASREDERTSAGDEILRTADDYRQRAERRRRAGELDGAIADFSRAIELAPHDLDAWNERGLARREKGDLDGAIADFSRAIEIDPRNPVAWNNRGNARCHRGELDAALVDYDRTIELDPSDPAAWNNRANVRLSRGELDAAIADYGRALELDPRFVGSWNNRGIARREKGDLAGAIADFDRALALRPDDPAMLVNRGIARKVMGDHEGAVRDLDRAVALGPGEPKAWVNRAIMRRESGDLDGSIADYDRAVAIDPRNAGAWSGRGLARKARGDLDGAIADLGRAIELHPRYAPAWHGRGLARYEKGDIAGAIADWSRFLELEPAGPAAAAVRDAIAKARAHQAGQHRH